VTVKAARSAGMTMPPLEHAAQTFDVGARLVGEVAQGVLTDLAILAVALAQEDGGRQVPVGNGLDIHS
jgi:hypothetical protein